MLDKLLSECFETSPSTILSGRFLLKILNIIHAKRSEDLVGYRTYNA